MKDHTIQAALGTNVRAIRARVHRARLRFREHDCTWCRARSTKTCVCRKRGLHGRRASECSLV